MILSHEFKTNISRLNFNIKSPAVEQPPRDAVDMQFYYEVEVDMNKQIMASIDD